MGGSLVVMGIALMGGVVVAFATSNAAGQTTAAAAPTSQPTTAAAAAVVPPPPIVSTPAAPATAPATAPAVAQNADWAETMNRLATLLAGKDLTALAHALEPAPVIRVFANDTLQTPERLLGHTTGSKVLGVHAYDKTPTTLATGHDPVRRRRRQAVQRERRPVARAGPATRQGAGHGRDHPLAGTPRPLARR
jgi:hypothetical protein